MDPRLITAITDGKDMAIKNAHKESLKHQRYLLKARKWVNKHLFKKITLAASEKYARLYLKTPMFQSQKALYEVISEIKGIRVTYYHLDIVPILYLEWASRK